MDKSSPYQARRTSLNYSAAALVFLAFQCLAQPVAAQDVLTLSGIEGTSKRVYGYVGAVVPILGEGKLTQDGLLLRFWADGQSFNYDRPVTTKVDATGLGLESAVGYQYFLPQSRLTGYVGVRYSNTDTSPNDSLNKSNGDHVGMRLQGEADHNFNAQWGVSAIGSYIAFLNDFWARIRPYYRINQDMSVGPDFVMFGGHLYDRQQFGAFIDGIPLGQIKLGLKVGSERDSRRNEFVPSFGANLGIVF